MQWFTNIVLSLYVHDDSINARKEVGHACTRLRILLAAQKLNPNRINFCRKIDLGGPVLVVAISLRQWSC